MKTNAPVRTIDPVEIQKLVDTGYQVDLIDVRTPAEFREVHAVGARNIPLNDLDPEQMILGRDSDIEPLYLICRSDSRGRKACEAFIAAGHTNVANVAGGTIAWADLGLPVVRGRKTISLERQVRITAGLLVVTSVVLGWALHPAWAGIAAFVGSGLVFAGLLDSCGMAVVLAKMPWNQVKAIQPDARVTQP
ncbi:MAG: rhodanese-like domain-containing protein [Fuerstiella sp.]|nr:rhodanese-like domain-containing protein [Fuerstiella sp.]MCP4855856.1 rhodanese-like domain-containing protein [Fuerstiella sp.]